MSDWEEDMYDDEEEEELSFEEDEDDDNQMRDVNDIDDNSGKTNGYFDLESLYFQAKNFKEEYNYKAALELFEKIITSDSQSEYKFKAIKQSIKIYELEKDIPKVLILLDQLFQMKSGNQISSSYFNSSLFKIVNRFERENNDSILPTQVFLKFNDFLLSLPSEQMLEVSNKKLKMKVQLCLANWFIKNHEKDKASEILSNLETEILNSNDLIKNTYHLEVLASQILLLLEEKSQILRLKKLTETANKQISGIPQSKIVGIINEGSGLVSLYSEDFKSANNYYQSAFKSYNDCGDQRRINVLIAFILTSLLSKSEVNPFQSSDFQGFMKLESINILMEIYNVFQNMDMAKFNDILDSLEFKKVCDEYQFLQDFLYQLKELFYINFLIDKIKLFDKVRYTYFTCKMNISLENFEQLLIKVKGKGLIPNYKIDFIEKIIIKNKPQKFIDIDTYQFLKNSLKLYIFWDKNENFNVRYEQLKQEMIQLARDSNDVELIDLDYAGIEKMNYFSNNNINNNSKIFNSNFEDNAITRTHIGNDNTSHKGLAKSIDSKNINIATSRFDTIFNVEILQQLSLYLYQDNIIRKDLTNDSQINTKLISAIDQYIQLVNNSTPINIRTNVSYFDKMKHEKIKNEFNKLFKTSTDNTNKIGNDENIPDVIQNTTMNQLELPFNPDTQKDTDALLTSKEKKLERLKVINECIEIITKKHRESKIKTCNFSTNLEHTSSNHVIFKKPNSELSRIMMNRVFQRQNLSADPSETTSLDNMSLDGAEEREDDLSG